MIRRVAAHFVQFCRGILDVVFDLCQRELIDGIFVPVGLAIHRMEREACGFSFLHKVRACAKMDTFHGSQISAVVCKS